MRPITGRQLWRSRNVVYSSCGDAVPPHTSQPIELSSKQRVASTHAARTHTCSVCQHMTPTSAPSLDLTHLCCLPLQPVPHMWPQLLLQVRTIPPLLLRVSHLHFHLTCGSRAAGTHACTPAALHE